MNMLLRWVTRPRFNCIDVLCYGIFVCAILEGRHLMAWVVIFVGILGSSLLEVACSDADPQRP